MTSGVFAPLFLELRMSFVPKTWANGPNGETPITAEELNRIEAGIDALYLAVAELEPVLGRVEDAEGAILYFGQALSDLINRVAALEAASS